jgi:hypothetical protein
LIIFGLICTVRSFLGKIEHRAQLAMLHLPHVFARPIQRHAHGWSAGLHQRHTRLDADLKRHVLDDARFAGDRSHKKPCHRRQRHGDNFQSEIVSERAHQM